MKSFTVTVAWKGGRTRIPVIARCWADAARTAVQSIGKMPCAIVCRPGQ